MAAEKMETDVLIIGAGPAGSAAGAVLAQRGRKVITLEAQTFPRFQIGESLLPRCNDLLQEAGLLRAPRPLRSPDGDCWIHPPDPLYEGRFR